MLARLAFIFGGGFWSRSCCGPEEEKSTRFCTIRAQILRDRLCPSFLVLTFCCFLWPPTSVVAERLAVAFHVITVGSFSFLGGAATLRNSSSPFFTAFLLVMIGTFTCHEMFVFCHQAPKGCHADFNRIKLHIELGLSGSFCVFVARPEVFVCKSRQ